MVVVCSDSSKNETCPQGARGRTRKTVCGASNHHKRTSRSKCTYRNRKKRNYKTKLQTPLVKQREDESSAPSTRTYPSQRIPTNENKSIPRRNKQARIRLGEIRKGNLFFFFFKLQFFFSNSKHKARHSGIFFFFGFLSQRAETENACGGGKESVSNLAYIHNHNKKRGNEYK